MNTSYTEERLRSFAEWLNQPHTRGIERALNNWLAEDPRHQEIWESWRRVNSRAKLLQIVPGDVNSDWTKLRDELGFVHTGKRKKRSQSKSSEREFFKQPSVVAIVSMIVYSLFLYTLHMLRIKIGF